MAHHPAPPPPPPPLPPRRPGGSRRGSNGHGACEQRRRRAPRGRRLRCGHKALPCGHKALRCGRKALRCGRKVRRGHRVRCGYRVVRCGRKLHCGRRLRCGQEISQEASRKQPDQRFCRPSCGKDLRTPPKRLVSTWLCARMPVWPSGIFSPVIGLTTRERSQLGPDFTDGQI